MAFVQIGGPVSKPTASFTPISDATASAPAPVAPSSLFSTIVNGAKAAVGGLVDFGKSVVGGAEDVAGDVWSAISTPPPPQSFNPAVADNAATGSYLDGLTSAGNQIIANATKAATDYASGHFFSGGIDVGQAEFGALNAIFAPVNAFVAYAQSIPAVGTLATGMNDVFSALATGGADAAEGAVDTLPVSQETKDTIQPLAKQIGALAAQVIAGHAGGEVFKAIGDHSKAIVDAVASDPATQEHLTEPADVASGGGSGPVPPPTAVEGASTEPAATSVPPTTAPALTLDAAPATEPAVPATRAPAPAVAPTEETKPLQTEPGVSKIGKSIEVKAVDAGLTQRFDKTAGYDPITIKDQAERATNFVNDNFDDARAVVRGEKPLPDGLRGTALVTAMEEYLKKTPDGDVAYELANSPLVSATSGAAQEMRLAAERDPDSITAKFKEVKAAREAALEKKGGQAKITKKVVDDIQREVKAAASKRPAWEDFIKEVQCNY